MNDEGRLEATASAIQRDPDSAAVHVVQGGKGPRLSAKAPTATVETFERLRYWLLYAPCHDHLMNWNYPLGDDGPDGSDGAGLEYVRSFLGGL